MYESAHWPLAVALLLSTGSISGVASGLFGIGGGIIRVPIFLYVFPILGVSPVLAMHVAVGTSLALGIPSTIAATWGQYRAGNLDTTILRTWVPALAAGVLLGLYLATILPGHVLAGIFGVLMLILSAKMLLLREDACLTAVLPGVGICAPIAFVIGVLSTLAGISGGPIVTPVLTLLALPIHRAIALSAAGSAAVATIGAAGMVVAGWHVPGLPVHTWGYVDLFAVLLILPVVTIAAPFGVRLANRLSKKVLAKALGVLLVVTGSYMIARVWFGLP